MLSPKALKLLTSLWLLAVLLGFAGLTRYQFTPGKQGAAPLDWPSGSLLPRQSDRATLVMALHPHCPCSRASLEELARTLAQCGERVTSHVLFLNPEQKGEMWDKSPLRAIAEEIPELQIWMDKNGEQAELFGSLTSGQIQIYDSEGKLLYAGGLTGSRGHAGDNQGKDLALKAIMEGTAAPYRAEVYGCSLQEPQSDSISPVRLQK